MVTATNQTTRPMPPLLEATLLDLVTSGTLRAYINRRWGLHAHADDLVADVVVRVIQTSHRFKQHPKHPPSTWIFNVARWVVINALRHHRVHVRAMSWHTMVYQDPHHRMWLDHQVAREEARAIERRIRIDVGEATWHRLTHDCNNQQSGVGFGVRNWAVCERVSRTRHEVRLTRHRIADANGHRDE